MTSEYRRARGDEQRDRMCAALVFCLRVEARACAHTFVIRRSIDALDDCVQRAVRLRARIFVSWRIRAASCPPAMFAASSTNKIGNRWRTKLFQTI